MDALQIFVGEAVSGQYDFDHLCDLCAGMFNDEIFWIEDEYQHHHDIYVLMRSSETGCHLCSLILGQISPEDIMQLQHDLDTSRALASRQIGINIRGSETLTLWVAASNSSVTRKGWDIRRHGTWTAIARLQIRLEKDDYTNESRSNASWNFSESTVAQISSWIEECHATHSQCRDVQAVAATRKILPTRLLDLTSALENGHIRLCSTQSLRFGIRYSTLSHCWGGLCKKRLTMDSLIEFQNGFSLSSLPKTFRDAVLVTRQLGLYYLWIDALCIIQDSIDGVDWRHEASLMGDVYANSYITLAATTSPNSEGGLRHRRNPLSVWPCRLTATWNCFQAGESVISSPDWANEIDMEPLGNRAWAFQEWLLSKRLLHFGNDQVRWQCHCLAASQVYPDGTGEQAELYFYGTPTKEIIVHSLRSPQDAALLWLKIREAYSRKALTEPTDRLTALSGIARMFHKALKSAEENYLAGMWKPNLLEELLWMRYDEEKTLLSPGTYIAPTWSWAYLNAPFFPLSVAKSNSEEYIWLTNVVDVKVSAVNDPFGPVESGSLTLRCPLNYITVISPKGKTSNSDTCRGDWKLSAINSIAVAYDCSLNLDHQTPPPLNSSTFCFLPIRASFWRNNPRNNTVAGLLLQKTEERRGQYRRIGLLNIFSGRHQQVLLSNLENGVDLSTNCYLETASRADRMIEVV